MTPDRARTLRARLILGGLVVGALAVGLWLALTSNHTQANGGGNPPAGTENLPPPYTPVRGGEEKLELDVKSKFSHIKVTRDGNVRTLWFVRTNGDEVIESRVDLKKPHDLLVMYTRYMFLSYLFRPEQEKVMIVGLGGGSMIHFLKHYDPKVKVDVLEIDPEVVKIADKYFGIKSGGNVNVITGDAFEYFKKTKEKYDVIYMDAFLKPSVKTDPTGVALRLKTIKFYKELQKCLTPKGMVVFNINPHEKIEDDFKNIRDAFPQSYVFELPREEGNVAVGSMAPKRIARADLLTAARELERRFKTKSYSYVDMARQLQK
jgi:spermidine synthase